MLDLIIIFKFLFGLIIYLSVILNYRSVANSLNLFDNPSKLKIHSIKTPLVGIFPIISIFIFFMLYEFIYHQNFNFFLIFLASISFFVLGLIDDMKNLNAYFKLFLTSLIIIITLFFSETLRIDFLYFETLNRNFEFRNIFFSIFFTSLCILLLANAFNLSDGINGLASGIATIWVFTLSMMIDNSERVYFFILSIFLAVNSYQIYKGKFFLGDSGSLFLGSLVGLLTIYVYGNFLDKGIVIPAEKIFLFFIVPGLDMLRLFIVRLSKLKDPFGGDLNHLHHYLIKNYSLKITLLIYWGLIIFNLTIAFLFNENLFLFIIFYILLKFTLLYFLKKRN